MLGRLTNNPRTLSDLPLIVYSPIEQFWFLDTLFLLVLTLGTLLHLGLSLRVLFVATCLLYPRVLPIPLGGWDRLEVAREFAPYLMLGALLGSSSVGSRLVQWRPCWLSGVVALGFLLPTLAVGFHWSDWSITQPVLAGSGTLAVVCLAILVNPIRRFEPVRLLGCYSLEIYVAHTIFTAATRIVLLRGVRIDNPLLHLALGTAAGLIGPLVLALACERLGFAYAFIVPRFSGERSPANRGNTIAPIAA